MTDLEVIHEFYQQISWADQCREIIHEQRTLAITPLTIAVPSHWQDYQDNLAFIIPLAQQYCLKPELIIWGSPSDYDTEKICWKLITNGVHVIFIDAQARLMYSRFILRSLDGANIQKTFSNFLSGKPEVVWTWDENKHN